MRFPTLAAIAASMAIFTATPSQAQQGVFSQEYTGCLSERGFRELVRAARNKDRRQLAALYGRECFPVGGLEYSVLQRGWTVSKVRVYIEDASVIMYVIPEAISRRR